MTDVRHPESSIPTLYDWAGGMPAIERLTAVFYDRVKADPVLAPVFAHISPEHVHNVAEFISEVLGGPKAYSARGGHPEMIRHHLGRLLTEPQRRQWATLIATWMRNFVLIRIPPLALPESLR